MLIIASTSTDCLARWKIGLRGCDAILEVSELSALKTCLASYTPEILLLDLDFPGLGGPAAIRKVQQASQATKIIVLGEAASDEMEISLFVAGIRGLCARDIEADTLQRVVAAVRQGEPWIRRSLVPRLLNELYSRIPNEIAEPVKDNDPAKDLTRREYQIALLVSHGHSNKQIARQLEITERTVKAHLTDTFRKLGIEDRLNLALLMSGKMEG